jgi:hypothetical protein
VSIRTESRQSGTLHLPVRVGKVPTLAPSPLAAPELLEAVDAPSGLHRAKVPRVVNRKVPSRASVFGFIGMDREVPAFSKTKENKRKTRRNPREHRAFRRGNTTGTRRTHQRKKALKSNHPWMGNRQEGRNPERGDCCWRGKSFEGSSVVESHRSEIREEIGEELQHGEPHDRQRGATNPQDRRRSKPSRRCETAKTEQDLSVATAGRNAPKRETVKGA